MLFRRCNREYESIFVHKNKCECVLRPSKRTEHTIKVRNLYPKFQCKLGMPAHDFAAPRFNMPNAALANGDGLSPPELLFPTEPS